MRVALADGGWRQARVLADDPSNDLAILKIEAPNLQAARIGTRTPWRSGSRWWPSGTPWPSRRGPASPPGWSAPWGAASRSPTGWCCPTWSRPTRRSTRATWGPLLNANAEVIGINTAGAGQAQGINFAVAINEAKPAMSAAATGQVVRPFLGVQVLGVVTPAIAAANDLPVDGIAVEPVPAACAQAGVRSGTSSSPWTGRRCAPCRSSSGPSGPPAGPDRAADHPATRTGAR